MKYKPFIAKPIATALATNQPVVALESAVIATGLPEPHNLLAAQSCEAAIRAEAAIPATIAIIEGQATIGCNPTELEALATLKGIVKTNLSNLGATMALKQWGATTVSTTMHLAHLANIRVFSTGGIGGVHREAEQTFDISADLMALARYPIIVVCAGAKSILDLPRTVELLETLGVPIIGYQTSTFSAFYSRSSGIGLDIVAQNPSEVAEIAKQHWQLGFTSGLLVVNPVPEEAEMASSEIDRLCTLALADAQIHRITGKAVTPYLLSRLEQLSGGQTLQSNIALLENNARTAAQIAVALSQISQS